MKLAKNLENLGTESAFAVLAEAKKLEAQGNPMIHMGLGQPDFKTPKHVVEAAKKALDDGHHGYVMSNGIPECRQAVTRWIKKRYEVEVDFERILIMPGGKPTMSYAIQCFGEPGAEIIHPTPAFPIYESMINYTGSTSVPYDLTEDKDLKFKADKILSLITDKTRLLILINPNNPTGSFVEKPEIDKLAEGLKKHPHVTILSDEIYSRQIFDDKEMPTFFNYPELRERLIVLEGWSKAYSMTGWRLGYIGAPKSIASACSKVQGQFTSGTCSITQKATIAAMEANPSVLKDMITAFKERRTLVLNALAEIPGIKTNHPGGAFYVFPDCSSYFGKSHGNHTIKNASDLCLYLLEESLVALVTGDAFGDPNCIRISYATSENQLIEGIKRIKNQLEQLS